MTERSSGDWLKELCSPAARTTHFTLAWNEIWPGDGGSVGLNIWGNLHFVSSTLCAHTDFAVSCHWFFFFYLMGRWLLLIYMNCLVLCPCSCFCPQNVWSPAGTLSLSCNLSVCIEPCVHVSLSGNVWNWLWNQLWWDDVQQWWFCPYLCWKLLVDMEYPSDPLSPHASFFPPPPSKWMYRLTGNIFTVHMIVFPFVWRMMRENGMGVCVHTMSDL